MRERLAVDRTGDRFVDRKGRERFLCHMERSASVVAVTGELDLTTTAQWDEEVQAAARHAPDYREQPDGRIGPGR